MFKSLESGILDVNVGSSSLFASVALSFTRLLLTTGPTSYMARLEGENVKRRKDCNENPYFVSKTKQAV